MKNKKSLTWLIISAVCLTILSVSIFTELSFVRNNDILWALSVCGITLSFLGFIFSLTMFIVSIIKFFISTETRETFADNFVHLRVLYKNGLLTKGEFEKKKKELLEKED